MDSALNWINPSNASPDYFNVCSTTGAVGIPNNYVGYQNAHSGFAYSGLFLYLVDYREYIEVPLISPLIANTCYHFEMYVSLTEYAKYTTDDIAVYFSDSLYSDTATYLTLPLIPQINNLSGNIFDTLNWVLVSGDYTATGGENYLMIGNFKTTSNMDTILANANGYSCVYVLIDDVSLITCITGINNINQSSVMNISPNPFTDNLTITLTKKEPVELTLYDLTSRKLLQQTFTTTATINTSQLAKGIYIYEVRNDRGVVKQGKVVKE
ncbi:MAG: T9SS type A sorting domain-containing protein [Bacteroidia bacterium]